MSDYISREAVLSLAKDICVLTKWDSEYRHRSIDPQDVRELPAADVQEAKTGRWIAEEESTGVEAFGFKEMTVASFVCSLCGFAVDVSEGGFHFCPNCGARMEVTE